MTGNIDREGRHLLQPFNRGVGEECAVGVELEQEAFAVGSFVDLKELRMHKDIAAGQIEPHNAELLHLVE